MLKKKLTIHAGMPKTGTTTIQGVFSENRDFLRRRIGLLYPDLWLDNEGIAHHKLGLEFQNGSADIQELLHVIENLAEPIDISEIFLSSEAFTNAIAGRNFEKFLEFIRIISKVFDVKIILTLREYSDFVESMYLHAVKYGEELDKSFDAYLSERLTWLNQFFENIGIIIDLLDVEVVFYLHDGNSIIGKFESLLGVGFQRKTNMDVNKKLSLKSQCLLYKHPICKEINGIVRSRLIKELESGKWKFDDDTTKYTLFRPLVRELLSLLQVEFAIKNSVSEYLKLGKNKSDYPDFFDLDEIDFTDQDELLVRKLLSELC